MACFFGGIVLIGVIDRLVPSFENPHEMHSLEELKRRPHNRKLMRMGLMTALVIGIHNFPEGVATFMSALDNPTLGIAIAAAHRHPQHSRRHRRFDTGLLRHRQPPAGVSALVVVGPGRAGRGAGWPMPC